MERTENIPSSPLPICPTNVDQLDIELQDIKQTGPEDNRTKAIVKDTCSKSIENWLFYGKMEEFEMLCKMLIGNKIIVQLNRIMAILAVLIQLIFFS